MCRRRCGGCGRSASWAAARTARSWSASGLPGRARRSIASWTTRSGAWPSVPGARATRPRCGSGGSTRHCFAAFCPTCRELVTPRLDGRCVACGTQTGANLEAPKPPPRAPRRRKPLRKGEPGWGPCARAAGSRRGFRRTCATNAGRGSEAATTAAGGGGGRPVHITEELLAEARRLYAGGLSLRQVAAELHPRTGYKTVASCAEALYGHFKRRGWKLRPQREVTAARNHKHGRKPRDADARAAERLPPLAGRAARLAGGPGAGAAALQGREGSTRPARAGRASATRWPTREYCYSHDPRRALERQARTDRMRARAGSQPSPFEQAA